MAIFSTVYQLLLEALASFTGAVRSSQVMVETTDSASAAEVRSSQVMIENTDYASAAEVRVSQVMIEVIIGLGISIDCANPPAGVVGSPYSHTLVVTGGTAPFTFTIVLGSLPPGLSLDSSTGVISGTPTTPGTYPFTVQVQDVALLTAQVACSILISGVMTLDCDSPPSGTVGTAYSHALVVSGGTAPYTFSIVGGSLPPGLSIDAATGVISGVPTTAGTFPFTAQVEDTNGVIALVDCSITIIEGPPPPVADCASPPPATFGVPYSHAITVTGGTPPYTFIIISGALPDGLTLDSVTGVISGTPTAEGTFGFTIQVLVSDDSGQIAIVTCSVTVNPPPPECPDEDEGGPG